MSKFNVKNVKAPAVGPIKTEAVASGTTYEGGPGFARDVKSELFMLAVVNFVGENTFYESAEDRDARFANLVRLATTEDPEWTARFLKWLRLGGNMRSASLVGAAEFVQARRAAGLEGMSRQVVDSVLQRADEPGEFLAYWTSKYGRTIPSSVKRGVADAAIRLYNQKSLLKYDAVGKGFRFGDVLNLTHAGDTKNAGGQKLRGQWQGDLFKYALDRRHGNDDSIPESLLTILAHRDLMSTPVNDRRSLLSNSVALDSAGLTWESLAGWLQGPMDKKAWEAIIPSMGYMALLRNLRNFDEAGVSDKVVQGIIAKLTNPDEVARSRQFPFRFLSAYEAAPSSRWAYALDQALQLSLKNIPDLPGRSLVLIDTSASMTSMGYSAKSKVSPAKAAALFGLALAQKLEGRVDVHGFANGVFMHDVRKAGSVLKSVESFLKRIGEVGHGTEIYGSLRNTFNGHDRVFIFSDMQTFADRGYGSRDVGSLVPASTKLYGFNLGGYQKTAFSTKNNRYELGGLTDATFRMVPLLEAGKSANWPF